MTEREKGEAALQFCEKWKGKGDEKQHCQKFWIDLLSNVYGIKNSTDYIVPEKK